MTITEGGGRRAVARKFQDVYLPALKANFMLWPMVQILNFRVIPLPFQIVSVKSSSVCSEKQVEFTTLTRFVTAFRFYRWYRMDCLPLPDELSR